MGRPPPPLRGDGGVFAAARSRLVEEWNYPLFEALDKGVPALSADRCPFFELMRACTGIVVSARNSRGSADAIEEAAAVTLPAADEGPRSIRQRFDSDIVLRRVTASCDRIAA